MPLPWLQSYLDGRTQYVKIGQHQSTAIQLKVGVPQGSVLGPILFAVYASPVADVIANHGVQYHQYADDTQLRLAMRADNTMSSAGLSVLAAYTSYALRHQPCRPSLSPIRRRRSAASQRNELGAWSHPDRHLTFKKHVPVVAGSCNYHNQANEAIHHIRHLLTTCTDASL